MSDLTALGLVLVVLYASECLVVARRGAVVFRLPFFFGGASAAPPSKAMGNGNVGLALLNPLPPFGRVYVTEPWPFVCDAVEVVAAQATSLWLDPKPRQGGRRLALAAIKTVRTIDKDVLVNGEDFVRCSSAAHARAAAHVLNTLAMTPADQRDNVLGQLLRDSFAVDVVSARVRAHGKKGQPLLVATIGCFAAFFVITPLMINHEGLERWYLWLGLIYGWVLLSALLAFMAHRALQPAVRGDRWMQLLLSIPAPTVALRGNDKLGRHFLAGLHPVAAAVHLLRGERRQEVVGAMLRDLRQPRLPALPVDDPRSAAIDVAFRARVAAIAEGVAVAAAVDVGVAFTAAGRTPLYCPRCHTGYTKGTGCNDCGGVALVARESMPTTTTTTASATTSTR